MQNTSPPGGLLDGVPRSDSNSDAAGDGFGHMRNATRGAFGSCRLKPFFIGEYISPACCVKLIAQFSVLRSSLKQL